MLPVLHDQIVLGHAESAAATPGARSMVDLGVAQRRAEIDLVELVAEAVRPAVFIGLVTLAALLGAVAALRALPEVAENLVEGPAAHVLLPPRTELHAALSRTRGLPQISLGLELLDEIVEGVVRLGESVLVIQRLHPIQRLLHIPAGVRDDLREHLEQALKGRALVPFGTEFVELDAEHGGSRS